MKLTPLFTEADVKAMVDEFLNRVVRVLSNELNQLGLEMVSEARLKTKAQNGFDDQTGNLRSSIFYSIIYDGQILFEDFKPSNIGTDKATGLSEARDMAEQVKADNPKGWCVVLGAGMEYGRWVESKGYDVITGSTLSAQKRLEGIMERVLLAFE